MARAYLILMCSSLVSLLSTIANDAEIPYKVGVSLNGEHIGDIKRKMLVVALGGMECSIGDTITLEDVWEMDDYSGYWWDCAIVIHLTSNGWVTDTLNNWERESEEETMVTRILRNPWTVTKELAHRFWGLTPGAKRIHKKQAARFNRRNVRRVIQEEMS